MLHQILPTIVAMGPINNNPALVQIMAWRRMGYKHYLIQALFADARGLNVQTTYEQQNLAGLKWDSIVVGWLSVAPFTNMD